VLKLGNSKEEDKKKKNLGLINVFPKSHESSKPKWKIGVVNIRKVGIVL
jgi:hypothetical protein